MDPGECLPLPGSDLVEPDDVEFYLVGRIESRNQQDFRSPYRTDLARQARFYGPISMHPPFTSDPALRKRYTMCEDVLISGPHGHVGGPLVPPGPPEPPGPPGPPSGEAPPQPWEGRPPPPLGPWSSPAAALSRGMSV